MFLLVSSQLISQVSNTNRTNCYSDVQVTEIFKGLKQNDYLKLRLDKTESTLVSADKLITEQKGAINTLTEIVKVKDDLIAGEVSKCTEEKNSLNAQIGILNNNIELSKIEAKKNKTKAFWDGIKIGGVSVAILGAVTVLLLN